MDNRHLVTALYEDRNTWEPWDNFLNVEVRSEARVARTAALPRTEAALSKHVVLPPKFETWAASTNYCHGSSSSQWRAVKRTFVESLFPDDAAAFDPADANARCVPSL